MQPRSLANAEWTASGGKLGPSGAPENDEVTPEMIDAGLEFFYGVQPFCDRPADRDEIEAALRSAYVAMRKAQLERRS